MTPDNFIEQAIDLGSLEGITALTPEQRFVFLISEAEVLCDMEGIDSFLDKYGANWLVETASAFEAVGVFFKFRMLCSLCFIVSNTTTHYLTP